MVVRTSAAAVRVWVVVLLTAAAGVGCGGKPPYRVSESRVPSAQELRRLGRIEIADPGARQGGAEAPRVYIGVPDRRAEGAVAGGLVGVATGAAIGGLAAGGGGMFPALVVLGGALVGAPIGVAIGAPVGASLGVPGNESRRAAVSLRRAAESVDVGAAARAGASRSRALPRDAAAAGDPSSATVDVEVIAYGTRAAGGGRARPFVAVRTWVTDAASGQVVYEATRDWRGPKRRFPKWADGDATEFQRVLEEGARRMGRLSVERALKNLPRGQRQAPPPAVANEKTGAGGGV